MFDVGGGELILIVLAIIVLFGPKKIPEIAQMVSKGMKQFRSAQNELKVQINSVKDEINSNLNNINSEANEIKSTINNVKTTSDSAIKNELNKKDNSELKTPENSIPIANNNYKPIQTNLENDSLL